MQMRLHVGGAKVAVIPSRKSLPNLWAASAATRFFTSVTGICSKWVINLRKIDPRYLST